MHREWLSPADTSPALRAASINGWIKGSPANTEKGINNRSGVSQAVPGSATQRQHGAAHALGSLGARHDLVFGPLEDLDVDHFPLQNRRAQRCLVDHVGQFGARKARGPARNLPQAVFCILDRDILAVDLAARRCRASERGGWVSAHRCPFGTLQPRHRALHLSCWGLQCQERGATLVLSQQAWS